jgi:glycosyltransferase involved in cell wall biosynthesis
MLSILIPVYNYSIVRLVTDLHRQALEAIIDFEIIVMEDGEMPRTKENTFIGQFEYCKHIILPHNIGRSAIRNKLADTAKYEHLLFLDCDAAIPNPDFISKYLVLCSADSVSLGGRIYQNNDPNYSLVTKYGRLRERNDLTTILLREKNPMFTTPNFLITKSIFNQVRFDESILGYGHEDTVFGIKLHLLNINFVFIDNPVVHVGIEDNKAYIRKTENAISNLFCLYKSGNYKLLEKESKLLSYFISVKRYCLVVPFAILFSFSKGLIKLQLCSVNPSLILFDIYKLLFICKTSLEK